MGVELPYRHVSSPGWCDTSRPNARQAIAEGLEESNTAKLLTVQSGDLTLISY